MDTGFPPRHRIPSLVQHLPLRILHDPFIPRSPGAGNRLLYRAAHRRRHLWRITQPHLLDWRQRPHRPQGDPPHRHRVRCRRVSSTRPVFSHHLTRLDPGEKYVPTREFATARASTDKLPTSPPHHRELALGLSPTLTTALTTQALSGLLPARCCLWHPRVKGHPRFPIDAALCTGCRQVISGTLSQRAPANPLSTCVARSVRFTRSNSFYLLLGRVDVNTITWDIGRCYGLTVSYCGVGLRDFGVPVFAGDRAATFVSLRLASSMLRH